MKFIKLLKLSNISAQEFKQILPSILLLWLLMSGLAIGRVANDTLFIGETGAKNLPQVYIFNALVLAIISLCYSLLEKRLPRLSFLTWIIVFAVLALVYLRSQFFKGYWWLPYAVFCYYEVLLLLIQMHFWTYINDILGPREGKRIFPYIGSIGLGGAISGGLFTWLTAPLIGFHNLFFVWIFLLICTIPITTWMKRTDSAAVQLHSQKQKKLQSLKAIWKIPLVRYLAFLSIPLWFVVHTVDWLFYLSIEEMFKDRPDELSSFLGLLGGAVSLLGIALQSFVSSSLLRRLGVGFSYSLYSLSVTFGAILFVIRGYLPVTSGFFSTMRSVFPVTIRFLDESVFFSIYDSALQLLYGALPATMRGQARAMIYGVMETGMTALTGGLLSLAVVFAIPQQTVAWSAMGVGIIWVLLSTRIKKHYLNALAQNLNSQDMDLHKDALDQIRSSKVDTHSRKLLLDTISSPDEEAAFLSMHYIQKLNDRDTLVELGQHISSARGVAFMMGLRLLSQNKITESLPKLKLIYLQGDTERRAAALSCIAQLETQFIKSNLNYFLESSEAAIRGAAILAFIGSQKRIHPRNRAMQGLKEMAYSNEPAFKIEAARAIAKLGKAKLAPLLLKLAKEEEPTVQKEAIQAMGQIKSRSISNFLVKALDHEDNMRLASTSLIRQGESCLSILHKEFRSLQKKIQARLAPLENLIFCMGEIGDTKSGALLANLLQKDKNCYYEKAIIRSLAIISDKNSTNRHPKAFLPQTLGHQIKKSLNNNIAAIKKIDHYLISSECISRQKVRHLLRDALHRNYEYCLNLMLKCLIILYDPVKVHAAIRGLESKEARLFSESIEILEGLGEDGKAVSKIIEKQGRNEWQPIREPKELLKELIKIKRYPWLNTCTLHAIGELGFSALADVVREFQDHPDPIIHASALLSLEKLNMLDTLKQSDEEKKNMSIDIERILFLRSVPIFSDVEVNDLQWISEIVHEKKIQANEYLFRENDIGDSFYIVQEGEVHIRKGRVILDTIQTKGYFGELAIFDQQTMRSASALVVQDTLLLSIERVDFQRLLMARPQVALAMFHTLSRRLRELTKKLEG